MAWNDSEKDDTTIYRVVVNHEEQYSILPSFKPNPKGWKDAGKSGAKPECLSYIKEVWTDMRPLSLRVKMEEFERNPPPAPKAADNSAPREKTLVERLCEGNHRVEVSLRPEGTAKTFKEALDRGYVQVRFTETKGGTVLGLRLNRDASDISRADFDQAIGMAHVEGNLTLDYVPVCCQVDIDVATLAGKGRLIKIEANTIVDSALIG